MPFLLYVKRNQIHSKDYLTILTKPTIDVSPQSVYLINFRVS